MPNLQVTGSPSSKLLILSDSPSAYEVRVGEMFKGQIGDVLRECMHAAKLFYSQAYVINIFPFKTEKNKAGDRFDGPRLLWHHKHGFTEAGMEEAAGALEKIQAADCNAILALGPVALSLLSGDVRPLGKWRGSPLWSSVVDCKYIATYHPGETLWGMYTWRYPIICDMQKIARQLDKPELVLPKRDIKIKPSLTEIMDYFTKVRERKRVCTDLEVMNEQIYCFSMSSDPHHGIVVPLVDPDGDHYWPEDIEVEIWREYGSILSDPTIEKINQNLIGFDAVFLMLQNSIILRGPLHDTMVAQHIMYPDFPKGLDFIASIHTDEPYWKDDGKIWKSSKGFDYDKFQMYCGRDAAVTLEAWDVLQKELDQGFWPAYNRTIRLAGPLAYMSVRGLQVDLEGLEETKKRITQAIKDKEDELANVADYVFSVSSPKQCQNYFYGHLGLKPYRNAQGGVTTDDKAMSRIFRKGEKGFREAKLVQELRALNKLMGTYLEVLLDSDHRLRCSWNPRGTWTGRLSSSKTILGKGMNLQNLHPEFKGFIVAG